MTFKARVRTFLFLALIQSAILQSCMGFSVQPFAASFHFSQSGGSQRLVHMSDSSAAAAQAGSDDLVACRITVTGDVHGGYYRACVQNEVSSTLTLAPSFLIAEMADETCTKQKENLISFSYL